MTLRDYFAAKWIAGRAAAIAHGTNIDYEMIARNAYKLADAMLESRTPKAQPQYLRAEDLAVSGIH